MFLTNFSSPKTSKKASELQTRINSLRSQAHTIEKKIKDKRGDEALLQAELEKTYQALEKAIGEATELLQKAGKAHLVERI